MLELSLSKQLREFILEVSFRVADGEIFVLMGRNGSGKSTTLHSIAGLSSPDTGSVSINGAVLFDASGGIDIPPEKRSIGYVFQKAAVFPHLSVRDNVAYGLRCQGCGEPDLSICVEKWLTRMGINDLQGVSARQLSGGQQQKVALARAFATSPSVLLLDEPFTALDAGSIHEVTGFIRVTVKERNIPCIIVTHRVSDAITIGDRVCLLEKGHVMHECLPEEVTSVFNGGFNSSELCTCVNATGFPV